MYIIFVVKYTFACKLVQTISFLHYFTNEVIGKLNYGHKFADFKDIAFFPLFVFTF